MAGHYTGCHALHVRTHVLHSHSYCNTILKQKVLFVEVHVLACIYHVTCHRCGCKVSAATDLISEVSEKNITLKNRDGGHYNIRQKKTV